MAIWPFGRKSKKTNWTDEKSMAKSKAKLSDSTRGDPRPPPSELNAPYGGLRPGRKDGEQRNRSSSRKLTKTQQSKTKDLEKSKPMPARPSVPPSSALVTRQYFSEKEAILDNERANHQLTGPPTDRGDIPSYYFQNPLSQSSIRPENFTAVPSPPTLLAKRGANDSILPRRKSSKRKADDLAREQEVKAMSSPVAGPKRPISHNSGLLARENKRVPGGLNRSLQRPTSEISLPQPESTHSSFSGISDAQGYKVSAFDALSPRPTIKYSENPRYGAGRSHLSASRTSTKNAKRPIIPEEVYQSKERIDDFADELDAGGLRELMERDQRRREKKRKSDQEKLQRRLERRAEKQSAEGRADERMTGIQSEGDGSTMPETVGLSIPKPIGQIREETATSNETWLHDSSRERLPLKDPFEDSAIDHETSHLEEATPVDEHDDPVIETAKAVRLSQASMSPPSSPRQQTQVPSTLSTLSNIASRSTPEIPERMELDNTHRDSDSSARLASNWTSFFKRGGTRGKRSSADRGRTTPSEFSNTSRESFARQPPSALARNVRARSGTPVRTQSKFREDLPELPISPPDSRVQSPEAAILPSIDSAAPGVEGHALGSSHLLADIHPAFREEIALSRQQSLTSPNGPSTALVPQSLASVDSEASWLSGRPPKRSSQTLTNPVRGSASSLQGRLLEVNRSEEGLSRQNDEDSAQLATSPEGSSQTREQSSTQIRHSGGLIGEDSDDESVLQPPPDHRVGGEAILHSAVARRPTIVKESPRIRSREGLLNDFLEGDGSAGSTPSADSPAAESSAYPARDTENSSVHRAMSVDLNKQHARHISAGSARLLDLPARGSGELKRLSTGSGERSPLREMPPDGRRES
ncbi:hypothetical protein MMC06_001700 [Schaereria dolodes]|nr:hypothetical protein [Schaereria dolodes]